MWKLIRLMLIASTLLWISSRSSFAGTVEVESKEYQVIKQAAREYAIVLGSSTQIDGYQFEKNVLTIRTKRANIAQSVTIELPENIVISGCSIQDGRLVVDYKASIDIGADVEKANKSGFIKGAIVGGLGGGLAGCILMAVVVIAL